MTSTETLLLCSNAGLALLCLILCSKLCQRRLQPANVIHHLAVHTATRSTFQPHRNLLTQLLHDNTLNSIGCYVTAFV